jgi:type IV pilus assembly protein PilQ
VVLGGVYSDDSRRTTDKIPLLGDIPFIGSLFSHQLKTDSKRELLIFVTPKILKEGIKVP